MLLFLGVASFLLATIDGICALLGYQLTEVSWSPALFAILAVMFVVLEASEQPTPRASARAKPTQADYDGDGATDQPGSTTG